MKKDWPSRRRETRGCKAFSTLTLYRYGNLRLVIASNVWGEVELEVVHYRARFCVLQQIFRGRNVLGLGLCDRQTDSTFSGSVCKRVVVYRASLDVDR